MRFRQLPLLTLATSLVALAQTYTLSGTVADIRSAPIPGVTVTLTGSATGRQVASTDESGQYKFPGVAAGSYLLTFDHAAFAAQTRSGELKADTAISVTLPIKGEVTSIEVVDVAGKATASRLEIPDSDMPVQVSSIPQQLLQQQAVNSMVEALKNASGVQAFRWYGVYEYYTIRGFNQADVMLVDGMRLEGNRFNTQTNNIESVEILKGPTSVLYGGGALGGVINVVRKKPQASRAHEFMYRGGRFNSHQVAGDSTGRVFNLTRLMYNADVSYDHSDGWRHAGSDRLNVSPSLTWLTSERSRLTIHQAFNRDRFDGDGGVDIGMTTLPNYDPQWRFSSPQDNVLVGDSQTHVLFNASLNNNWEFRNGFLLRRTSDRYFVTEGIYYDSSDNVVYREPLDFHHTRRPVQNQADLIGRLKFLGMRHTVLGGYEYQDYFTRTDVTEGDPVDGCGCGYWPNTFPNVDLTTVKLTGPEPTIDLDNVYRRTYTSNRIHAGYWQDQIDVLPNLKINLAGRFDDYDRASHRIFTAAPDVRRNIQTRHQTAYTYRAGIVYTPFGNHQFYFNSATSFSPVTTVPANGAELKPQHGRTYEVGHRWQTLNGRMKTNLAFYKIDRDGQTVQVSQTTVQQVGSLKSKGIDLDVNTYLGWTTRLIASYGFAQANFEDPGSLNGKFPRYVPKHTANVWLRKEWGAGYNAAIGTRYVGPQFANNGNNIQIGGYNTLSGAFGVRKERWEWSLNADNLFNRQRYFIPGHFDNIVFPGAPINVSSTIRLRFN